MSALPKAAASPTSSLLTFDDGVPVLVLPSTPSFDDLRTWLQEQLADHVADLSGRAVRLNLGERRIVLFDVRRLVHLLRDTYRIEVTGLYVEQAALHSYAERELKLKLFVASPEVVPAVADAEPAPAAPDVLPGLDDLTALLSDEDDSDDDNTDVDEDAAPQDDVTADAADGPDADDLPVPDGMDAEEARDVLAASFRRSMAGPAEVLAEESAATTPSGRPTQSIYKTLRSGSSVRFDGDVLIMGDVNPGAQVTATGDVLVLGRLRGLVHAGAEGDTTAFVLAFELLPSQLRIAHHIAMGAQPNDLDTFQPVTARIADDEIVIEPYRGRFRR